MTGAASADPAGHRRGLWGVLTGPAGVRVAWIIWIVVAAAVITSLLMSPTRKRTNGAYRSGAIAYLHSEPMYTPGPQGFIYPVQSAMVYIPFTFEPRIVGEVLWRLVGIGAFGAAIWRLANATGARRWPGGADLFLVLSLISIPPAVGAARNGQMNLILGALLVHGVVEIIRRRWGPAALWLCLALACKPIAVVPLLLFTALYPPLWWRVPLGLAVVAAAPFFHPDWAYVAEQYRAGLSKVLEAGEAGVGQFADLTSLLRPFTGEPDPGVMTVLRAAAAAGTLACAWLARRHLDHRAGAVIALALGTAYLMVFNPRTEGNTYLIMTPPVAVLAAWSLREATAPRPPSWSRPISALLLVLCVLLGFAQFFVPRQKERWIRPAVACVVLGWLAVAAAIPPLRPSIPRPPDPV
jgi:alpha-1,2-mannosyltransferase